MTEHDDVPIATSAPCYKSAALRAITDIAGMARLLLRGADPGPPLDVSELRVGGDYIVSAAERLKSDFSLWLRIVDSNLLVGRQHVLLGTVDAIRQHADGLAQYANFDTLPATDHPTVLARVLSLLVELLRQELIATPPAPRPPGEPVGATTGEHHHA